MSDEGIFLPPGWNCVVAPEIQRILTTKAPTGCPPFIECTDKLSSKEIVTCRDCRFLSPVRVPEGADYIKGACRKNAPLITDNQRASKFPIMDGDEWCGEGER